MNKLLFAAMTAFGRVFIVTFLFALTSIATAPDQQSAIALSWAALVASIAAGLRAIQIFFPGITFKRLLPQPLAAWVDAFTLAFLAAFVTTLTGWLAAPDFATWKAAITGFVIGGLTAGVRALQGLATPGEKPAPTAGIKDPGSTIHI
jgi:hypothetical protein